MAKLYRKKLNVTKPRVRFTQKDIDKVIREVNQELAELLYKPTDREACVMALRRIVQLSTSVQPNRRADRRAIHQLAKDTLVRLGDLDRGKWED